MEKINLNCEENQISFWFSPGCFYIDNCDINLQDYETYEEDNTYHNCLSLEYHSFEQLRVVSTIFSGKEKILSSFAKELASVAHIIKEGQFEAGKESDFKLQMIGDTDESIFHIVTAIFDKYFII